MAAGCVFSRRHPQPAPPLFAVHPNARRRCRQGGDAPTYQSMAGRSSARPMSALGPILLQKSVASDGCPSAVRLRAPGFDLPASTLLRNSYSTRCTEPDMAAAGRPAMRGAAGSGRQRERTRPGRLAGPAVEAVRAAGCASSARTASRSSYARAAIDRSPRCQRVNGQRLGITVTVHLIEVGQNRDVGAEFAILTY